MMKKVLLQFYGKNNLGDDLFVKIITDRYVNQFSTIISCANGSFAEIKTLKLYSWHWLLVFTKIIEKVFRYRNLALGFLLKRHDILVYIGGSLFMESIGLDFWKRERLFFQGVRVPYYILGSNVGPVYTEKFVAILRDIFRGAKDVCFRDTVSYDMFKDTPTTRAASDIVFTLDKQKYEVASEKLVVFSVIDGQTKFKPDKTEKYEQEVAKLVERFTGLGYRIVLMSFCRHEGDERAIARVLERLKQSTKAKVDTYLYSGNLDEALTMLGRSEIVIASRFHAAIIGLLFGKKTLPMAYSDKTTNILKDMDFLGPIIDINRIDEFDASTFDIDSIAGHDVSSQRVLAEKQFQELDKVLTKR